MRKATFFKQADPLRRRLAFFGRLIATGSGSRCRARFSTRARHRTQWVVITEILLMPERSMDAMALATWP